MYLMSRTNRNYISESNYREARKGRINRETFYGANNWSRHNNHGGMLMSSSNTGYWWDERADIRLKRAIKRGERQRARRNIQEEIS